MFVVASLIIVCSFVESVVSLTAPAWPEIWSANFTLIGINNESDILDYGAWYYNISVNEANGGLLRQDSHGCGAPFNGYCRGIFRFVTMVLYSFI